MYSNVIFILYNISLVKYINRYIIVFKFKKYLKKRLLKFKN